MRIFVSSTFVDLEQHRIAVNEVLLRMKTQFSAMEYFGSRGDDTSVVCFDEIADCNILIGIYAWRYGWQPRQSEPSITEQEFDYARLLGKKCLCYIVDEDSPWVPVHIDQGDAAIRLKAFKAKVSGLVRSKFTTPDNLAKQVAADLAREMSQISSGSFGNLLQGFWEVFAPELQMVLAAAYWQARKDNRGGTVATRHVIAALASIPNTAQPLITSFPNVQLPSLSPNIEQVEVAELFFSDRSMSSCVLGSMERLLPGRSPTQQLLAIELAFDLLKNGTGTSVEKFRRAGVDSAAVARVEDHIRRIARNPTALRRGLQELNDSDIVHLAYVTRIALPPGLMGDSLRAAVLRQAQQRGVSLFLAAELLRRHPELVGLIMPRT